MTNIMSVSQRARDNANKAFMRDPTRPINYLDFMTKRERQVLVFTGLRDIYYEGWMQGREYV